jgi:hypothetical protein
MILPERREKKTEALDVSLDTAFAVNNSSRISSRCTVYPVLYELKERVMQNIKKTVELIFIAP